jgi:hypothetical protein
VEAKLATLLLLTIPLICYAVAAGFYFGGLGRVGMALTFFGYSIANVGLIMDLYGK